MLEVSSVINFLAQNNLKSTSNIFGLQGGITKEVVMSVNEKDGLFIINLLSGLTFYVIPILDDPFKVGENKAILFSSAEIRGNSKLSTMLINGVLCIGYLDSNNYSLDTQKFRILRKRINDKLILIGLFDQSLVEIGADRYFRVLGYDPSLGYIYHVYLHFEKFDDIINSNSGDLEVTSIIDFEVFEIVERRV